MLPLIDILVSVSAPGPSFVSSAITNLYIYDHDAILAQLSIDRLTSTIYRILKSKYYREEKVNKHSTDIFVLKSMLTKVLGKDNKLLYKTICRLTRRAVIWFTICRASTTGLDSTMCAWCFDKTCIWFTRKTQYLNKSCRPRKLYWHQTIKKASCAHSTVLPKWKSATQRIKRYLSINCNLQVSMKSKSILPDCWHSPKTWNVFAIKLCFGILNIKIHTMHIWAVQYKRLFPMIFFLYSKSSHSTIF